MVGTSSCGEPSLLSLLHYFSFSTKHQLNNNTQPPASCAACCCYQKRSDERGERNIMVEGICNHCGITCTNRCSTCKAVFYCSTEHQRNDWKVHKQCCRSSNPLPPHPPNLLTRAREIIFEDTDEVFDTFQTYAKWQKSLDYQTTMITRQ